MLGFLILILYSFLFSAPALRCFLVYCLWILFLALVSSKFGRSGAWWPSVVVSFGCFWFRGSCWLFVLGSELSLFAAPVVFLLAMVLDSNGLMKKGIDFKQTLHGATFSATLYAVKFGFEFNQSQLPWGHIFL